MNITFVGGGNMAVALIGGMLQQGFNASQIQVVEKKAENRERIKREFSVKVVAELVTGIMDSDIIVLAVKPQQLPELARQLRSLIKNQLVVSIAAGIRATDISRWLGGHHCVIRAMPNTPSLVRAGATGLYALPAVNDQERKRAENILAAVGTILWVEDEDMLHAITAISGSGPAYIFYFIEAVQQAGIELGLTPDQARQLSLQTFSGAVKLASQSDEDVSELRFRVSSKGGTTEQAIQAMEKNDIKRKIIFAINAAKIRSQELSEEFSKK